MASPRRQAAPNRPAPAAPDLPETPAEPAAAPVAEPAASPSPAARRSPARQALLAGLLIALGLNLAALLAAFSTRGGGALSGSDVLLAAVTLGSGLALLAVIELGSRSSRPSQR